MSLLPQIPTAAELTAAGIALEDHAAMQGKALIDLLAARVSDSLTMGLNAVGSIEGKAALDVKSILGSLDGWTLTINPIGPITIQLSKPK